MKLQGVFPEDELWLARQLKHPTQEDDDGVCFATFNGETLGPFACKADAHAAHQRKLDELAAQGIDPTTAEMGVVFADPAIYHVPNSESQNA